MLTKALDRLHTAIDAAGLPDGLSDALAWPKETMEAHLPVRRDDGSMLYIPAWRCRYEDALGPTKGGVRFSPGVNAEEVKTLALWMTLKCALMHLPYGGGKGGAAVDLSDFSAGERERLTRAYASAFAALIGPERDIPAPDVGTGAREMAWMMDEYATLSGAIAPDVVTGKPISLGGLPERHDATGLGALYALDALRDTLGLEDGARIAVQGFGSGGRVFAREAAQRKYRIVCVSDSSGALFNGDGLDIDAVIDAKSDQGRVDAGPGDALDRDAVFDVEADLLVPAALGGVVTAERAQNLQAKALLEIANGPVLPEADEALRSRGVRVVPDILANAGGVYVSWLEWAQTKRAIPYEDGYVAAKLEGAMRNRATQVMEKARKQDGDLRLAAYTLAAERLAGALTARGRL